MAQATAPILDSTVVAIGSFIPVLFGKETVAQLEAVTETVPALA
jgi:hypothetical protein